MTGLRFVHISDTHIGPTSDYALRGCPALPTLEVLVEHINALPFTPDFVLHTGDVVDDRSEVAYKLAKSALEKLRFPVYYVAGNHDDPQQLRGLLSGVDSRNERFDYYREITGFRLAVYDSRNPAADPAGTLTARQLQDLHMLCLQNGPPLIIALHHQPVKLDSTWLDEGFDDDGAYEEMMLECTEDFLEAIAPARERICGVFFGHVHRGFQAVKDGVLFSSAPSALLQFQSYPGQAHPVPAYNELPGYSTVTVQDGQTIVRQYTFPRPIV